MKPIELVMEAFGPFKDCAVIDFRPFYQTGIFTLSGPTGAGKSTVFDAICFALYGKAASNKRSTDNFRSMYAEDKDICRVKFTFQVKDREYCIERSPKQTVLGARGKLVNKLAAAALHLPDKQVITAAAEIEEKIEELLQMTFSQFSKVVLLPQGEFQNFLLAKSGKKQEILSDVFHTAPYRQFAERLKAQYEQLEQEQTDINTQIKNYLGQIRVEDNLQLEEALLEEVSDNALIALLREDIYKREQTHRELQGKLSKIEREKEKYNLEQARTNNQLLEQKGQLQEQLVTLEKQAGEMDWIRRQLKAHQQAKELGLLRDRLAFYRAETKRYEAQREELHMQLRSVQKEMKERASKQGEIDRLEERNKELQRNLLQLERAGALLKQRERYTKESAQIGEATLQLKKKQVVGKELLRVLENIHTKNQLQEKIKQLSNLLCKKKECTSLFEEITKKGSLHQKLEQLVQMNRCAVIAGELQEGKPCPVCGALRHPVPAVSQQVNLQEVELLRKELEHSKGNLQVLEAEIRQLVEALGLEEGQSPAWQLEQCERQAQVLQADVEKFTKEYRKPLPTLEEMPKALAKVEQQLLNYKERIEELRDFLEELEKELGAYTFGQEALGEQRAEIDREITQNRQVSLTFQKRQSELIYVQEDIKKKLLENKEQAAKTQEQLKEVEEQLQKALNAFQLEGRVENYLLNEEKEIQQKTQIERYDREVTQTKSRLELLITQTEGLTIVDLEGVKQQLESLQREQVELRERYSLNQAVLHTNSVVLTHLEKYNQMYYEKQKAYKEYKFLFNLSVGDNEQRVSFERYVLGVYFNEVLLFANLQLEEMSRGRYQMKRSEIRARSGAHSGLDIEVVDTYNYSQRDITTLSGGETFLASLSLALGMSEIIGNMSGVASTGMLFIDEGFGSLDEATLEITIGVLNKLKEQGLLIGLISHVHSIKEQVDCRVEVTPTKNGSILKTIC